MITPLKSNAWYIPFTYGFYLAFEIPMQLMPHGILLAIEYIARIVVLQMSLTNVREIYVLCTYRPPDGSIVNFIRELEAIRTNLSNKAVIEVNIVGDVNINPTKRDPNTKR